MLTRDIRTNFVFVRRAPSSYSSTNTNIGGFSPSFCFVNIPKVRNLANEECEICLISLGLENAVAEAVQSSFPTKLDNRSVSTSHLTEALYWVRVGNVQIASNTRIFLKSNCKEIYYYSNPNCSNVPVLSNLPSSFSK